MSSSEKTNDQKNEKKEETNITKVSNEQHAHSNTDASSVMVQEEVRAMEAAALKRVFENLGKSGETPDGRKLPRGHGGGGGI